MTHFDHFENFAINIKVATFPTRVLAENDSYHLDENIVYTEEKNL